MKKQTLAFLTASFLASTVLASGATSEVKHEEKHKSHHHHAHHVAAPAAPVVMEEAKTNYLAIEGTYNFTRNTLKFANLSTTSKKFDDTGSFGLGAGTMVNEHFKVDAILSYVLPMNLRVTHAEPNYTVTASTKVTTTKLMLNGTYDFGDLAGGVSPYVSLGLGTAYNQSKDSVSSVDSRNRRSVGVSGNQTKNKFDFAYQMGAGLAYKVSSDVSVDLGYRFADNGRAANSQYINHARLQSHAVVLGIKVPF